MFSSVFHQLRKTIVKLLLMSSKVLSLRSLPPFIPSTSKWYFASTEQNLNRGRLSLVLNLEHTNLSNCQVYWNVFFSQSSQMHKYFKKIWNFLLWVFSSPWHSYMLHTVCKTVMHYIIHPVFSVFDISILHHRNSVSRHHFQAHTVYFI